MELEQAHKTWDFQSLKKVPKGITLGLVLLVFGAACYFASYTIAYRHSPYPFRQPCASMTGTVGPALYYWYLFAIYAARGLLLVIVCALYFDRKAMQVSQAGGPLT